MAVSLTAAGFLSLLIFRGDDQSLGYLISLAAVFLCLVFWFIKKPLPESRKH
jgi:hypothetical protein